MIIGSPSTTALITVSMLTRCWRMTHCPTTRWDLLYQEPMSKVIFMYTMLVYPDLVENKEICEILQFSEFFTDLNSI